MRKITLLILFICYFVLGYSQIKNGTGLNLNLGTNKRLNISFCFERKLFDDVFFKLNIGYGNLIPFNNIKNTDRLFLMRKKEEPANHFKHLDLIYKNYTFYAQESKITAPELKIGAIFMLKKFQSNYRE
ncbi:MAG: hypothetical protein ACK452_13750, partial [Bacteroidota bacterium]